MLIRSRFLHLFIARLGEVRGSTKEVETRFGIPEDAAQARTIEVPWDVACELPELVARSIGQPDLGLDLVTSAPPGLSILEFLGRTARTLEQAIEQVVEFHRLANDAVELHVQRSSESLALVHRLPGQPRCLGRHLNEFVVGLLVRATRETLRRPDWNPLRVELAHDEPAEPGAVRRFFGPHVHFGCGHNALYFAIGDLSLPIATADPFLNSALKREAAELMSAQGFEQGLLAHVRAQIVHILPQETPTLARVARGLALSTRTLQRRLREHGVRFSDVVDATRCDLAVELLECSSAPIAEIAAQVGYSDASTFTRAFSRWRGTSPAEFRDAARR